MKVVTFFQSNLNVCITVHIVASLILTLLSGYVVAQVRAILQPVSSESPPLIYAKFFNFSDVYHQMINNMRVVTPAPKIEMFVVRRRFRSNGTPLGDIIPLDRVHQVVQLVPRFGVKAPKEMMGDNSLQVGHEFYINSFADKETFHAILSNQ